MFSRVLRSPPRAPTCGHGRPEWHAPRRAPRCLRSPRGALSRSCSRDCAWCPRGAPERSPLHASLCFGFSMPRVARVRASFTNNAMRCNTVGLAPRCRPPRLNALRRDNHLITPAGGHERLGETLARFGPLGSRRRPPPVMPRGRKRDPAWRRVRRVPVPKPSPELRRPGAGARKRRREVSAASLVNRGAGGVCNRRSNSGGGI